MPGHAACTILTEASMAQMEIPDQMLAQLAAIGRLVDLTPEHIVQRLVVKAMREIAAAKPPQAAPPPPQ